MFGPSHQYIEHVFGWAIVEAPFAFLEEQVEVLFRDAIEAAQVTFGLVPEILDAIDMVAVLHEGFRVIDPHMAELGNIKGVIAGKAVRVDNAIRLDGLPDDR